MSKKTSSSANEIVDNSVSANNDTPKSTFKQRLEALRHIDPKSAGVQKAAKIVKITAGVTALAVSVTVAVKSVKKDDESNKD